MSEKKDFYKKINSLSFIFLIFSIFLYCFINFIFNPNIINDVENRNAYQFKKLKFKDYNTREFQKNFEKTVSDQIPYSSSLNIVSSKVDYYFTLNFFNKYKHKYVPLKDGLYLYNNYLLFSSNSLNTFKNRTLDEIENINKLYNETDINIYFYFIETESIYNFENNNKIDTYNYFINNLNINEDNIEVFEINDFSDYKKYFYKMDHHWNNNASYKAYLEIANMMNFKNKISIRDETCYDKKKSYGSKYRLLGIDYYFNQSICKYSYNFPSFYIYADGKRMSKYETTSNLMYKKDIIDYDSMYYQNTAEIIFENLESNNDKNLLVYSNSFSKAINQLLGSEYKTTYVVDGRFYDNFNILEYIESNNIDDLIIVSNYMYFVDKKGW